MTKPPKDQFSKKETEARMVAALRGSRVTGHKPMTEVVGKRNLGKVATKPTKAKKSK